MVPFHTDIVVPGSSASPSERSPSGSSVQARCGGCTRTWTGHTQAHCKSCHQHFTSDAAFDRHREGSFDPRHEGTGNYRHCIPVARFAEPYGKRGNPRLSLVVLADGPTWAEKPSTKSARTPRGTVGTPGDTSSTPGRSDAA